jgi:hypothetical protein
VRSYLKLSAWLALQSIMDRSLLPKLSACDERVQHSLANSNEPSGIRFAVEQDMLVHIETSGFSLI